MTLIYNLLSLMFCSQHNWVQTELCSLRSATFVIPAISLSLTIIHVHCTTVSLMAGNTGSRATVLSLVKFQLFDIRRATNSNLEGQGGGRI